MKFTASEVRAEANRNQNCMRGWMLEAFADTLEVQQWRPIETAPTDGSRILVALTNGAVVICKWTEEEAKQPCSPTHWMPLPLQPNTRI